MRLKGCCDVEERSAALLVYGQDHPLRELADLLTGQGVETSRARDCAQAARALRSQTPPVLVFTATNLADGSWEDILRTASTACCPVPIVVVSRQEDVSLSLRVWESGGANCIAPPFRESEIAGVVRGAMLDGFLAECSWPPTQSSSERMDSNAENHLGSGVLAA
jgi:DNA-binding response OmpR family regulator